MGRIYTITAEGMTLDDAKLGDLLTIQAAANKPFTVLSARISQRDLETATQARFRLLRRSAANTTTPVSGTAVASKHNASDAAASVTLLMNMVANSPTLGTVAGIVDVLNESLPNGATYLPTPEERQVFCGTSDYFAVNMPAAHGVAATNVTFDVKVVIEELG